MKSSNAPTPPDPTATAQAQTQSNEQTANYQQGLNLINQVTPLGSLTYNQTGTGSAGNPEYTATTALSPTGQQNFDLQQQVSGALNNLALSGTNQVSSAMSTPLTYSGLPTPAGISTSTLPSIQPFSTSNITAAPSSLDLSNLPAAPSADPGSYNAASDALYDQATSRLDPQWQKAQTELETQLANEGITQNSTAWNNAMNQFGQTKNDAYSSAQNDAVAGAEQYQTEQVNNENTGYQAALGTDTSQFSAEQQARNASVAEALSGSQVSQSQQAQALSTQEVQNSTALQNRQQGISEADYLRELPINEVSSLLNGGQVSQPTFGSTPQTSVANTNVAGIDQSSYEDAFQNYQTQMQQQNAIIGAVAGLGGAALSGGLL